MFCFKSMRMFNFPEIWQKQGKKLQVGRIMKNKTEMQFFNSIAPKITSVSLPCIGLQSTEHGLTT